MSTHSADYDRAHAEGVSLSDVDLMLRQLQRDRETAHWGSPPHSESLDGAESWLLSLRDWLESRPANAVRNIAHRLKDCWCKSQHRREDFL